MVMFRRMSAASGPGVIDALSLLSEVASELVVKSARDTHFALRPHRHDVRRSGRGARLDTGVPAQQHRAVAARERRGSSHRHPKVHSAMECWLA